MRWYQLAVESMDDRIEELAMLLQYLFKALLADSRSAGGRTILLTVLSLCRSAQPFSVVPRGFS